MPLLEFLEIIKERKKPLLFDGGFPGRHKVAIVTSIPSLKSLDGDTQDTSL
jgi:hypothetical protein